MTPKTKTARWCLAGFGLTLIVLVVVLERQLLGLGPFREGAPDLTGHGALRAGAYACGAFAVAWAAGSRAGPGPALWPAGRIDRLAVVLAFAFVAAALTTLLVSPPTYDASSVEDGIVEWPSAIFPLFASLTSLALAWRLRGRTRVSAAALVALVAYAVVCFCIAGEEVSWLQRVIGFNTPASMPQNYQGEFNLHNYATNHVENAYYFCAGFVLFVVLPLWHRFGLPLGPLQPLAVLMPRPHMMVFGALITAYNFDMWNGAPTQIAFWGTIAGLTVSARASRSRFDALATWGLVAAMVVVQGLLLWYGGDSDREWDHTEYKELLISSALWLYATDLCGVAGSDASKPSESSTSRRA